MLMISPSYTSPLDDNELSFEEFKELVLKDYKIAVDSRHASMLGRREVLTGKAKFGIFGDGKEIPQIAMAKVFQNGDFRAGYYRDQTFMFATGLSNIPELFAQLYANTDIEMEPHSAGRAMSCHYATRSLNPDGTWRNLMEMKNTSSDISPTGAQMPRLLGLAQASKFYRENPELAQFTQFSHNGNEIAFGTIGNASTSEGLFLEAINAAGVLQVPMLISVWDDDYGISVPAKYHTTKESISEALKGFIGDEKHSGLEIFQVKGWDYPSLCQVYQEAAHICREKHIPVLVHVTELTQPQGHSTSGSHERYKDRERLDWEMEFDCNTQMRKWIIESAISTDEELKELENQSKLEVKEFQKKAWANYNKPIEKEIQNVLDILSKVQLEITEKESLEEIKSHLSSLSEPSYKDVYSSVRRSLWLLRFEPEELKSELKTYFKIIGEENYNRYNSHLFTNTEESALKIKPVAPFYNETSALVDGREILQACFDLALARDPRLLAFGEDVGKIGDVNQGFAGLQQKYGELRVMDTGIREATIIGQGIGLALRGLRPIAEIQYLDYLLFGIEPLSDDLACLSYRTKGGQKAPLIVRTRGHRLEGTFHAGSPLGMIINSLRGMHILTPRNMTQAAGFYNTLFQSDEPALMIECLNAYRLKEKMPINLGDFRLPLGVPEILLKGNDITVITYGACCRVALEASLYLQEVGIEVELIDVQTLLPFDVNHTLVESLRKTNRVLFLDEDLPGGASAYMMQQVLEVQGGYYYLDSRPQTLTAKDHRTAYGSDGDYFCKPSADDVFEKIYGMMAEIEPSRFPKLY
jgi:pyruvate/2-oxoglutarate/acetoin dehydrogenase E1 component/TPP-dependent pyruvate/acetoin dehydrogenase alpha subunit